MEFYKNYQEIIDKTNADECMSYTQKKQLIDNIDKLETMDHISILKIIHECMNKKPYSVTNKQTMLDLDDLSNQCLWKIMYYVNLCLDNVSRQQAMSQAEHEHQHKLEELDNNMKHKAKLKLTALKNMSVSEYDDNLEQDGDMYDDKISLLDNMDDEL